MPDKLVRPKNAPSKADVSGALSVAWARTANQIGKGAMADKLSSCTKTIDRTLTGESVPELHTALASLLVDDSALDEVFALYGLASPRHRHASPANDLATVSGLSGVVTAFCEAIQDGQRDHRETLALADLIRTVMPSLTDILDEANRLRGVKAA